MRTRKLLAFAVGIQLSFFAIVPSSYAAPFNQFTDAEVCSFFKENLYSDGGFQDFACNVAGLFSARFDAGFSKGASKSDSAKFLQRCGAASDACLSRLTDPELECDFDQEDKDKISQCADDADAVSACLSDLAELAGKAAPQITCEKAARLVAAKSSVYQTSAYKRSLAKFKKAQGATRPKLIPSCAVLSAECRKAISLN